MRLLVSALTLCLSLFAFANLPAAATPASAEDREQSSHAEWTRLLQTYVKPYTDGINRFDYAALKANSADRAILKRYIARLSAEYDPDMPTNERFALLANLYNALTVQVIIEDYPVSSIRDIKSGLLSNGPWSRNVTTLNGKAVSLDDIEHNMLRVQYNEPRIHYAVNCASMGCPNLRRTAWEADTLDADLTDAAREYINHPRGVSVRKDGRLKVSRIYNWYREDFGGNEQGVIDHLLTYAEPDLARKIRARPDIASHGYDWSLNDTN